MTTLDTKPAEQPKDQEQRSILINFVLDKSGSMEAIRSATISGFNEFLGDQKKEGGDARLTLTLFDTETSMLAQAVPVRDVVELDTRTYRPDGCTALYDAIGHTMRVTDDYVAHHHPDQVLFVVMTDGLENASREFTREVVFQMIEDRRKLANYEFIYLGANQDSFATGATMGIRDGRTLDYSHDEAGAREAWTRASYNTRAFRRQGVQQAAAGQFFSPDFEKLGEDDYEEHRRKRAGGER